ncbi:MAG: sulfotransferase family 2 domain-containing protein [Bdellovibrionales bacterium]|nr:sulfotransferase family 2 domain-containing protein [Bdellovibrionales bacterium]
MEQPTVLFCHAGRTGGDTLNRVLKVAYHPYASQHYDTANAAWPFLRSAPPEALERIKCFYGHGVYFGFHSFLHSPTTYITLVRNPVKRIVSQYYCYLHDPNRGMHQYITENNISLEQYQNEARNEQAHYILGFPHYRLTRPSIQDLPSLFENIQNHFSFVGVTERYNESIYMLHKKLGWKQWRFWKKTLANPLRPELEELPSSLLEEIAENNELDMALHKYASDRLEKELSSLSQVESDELLEYIEAQECYTTLLSHCPKEVRPSFCGLLLQKRHLKISCLCFLPEAAAALGHFSHMVNTFPGREIIWENILYKSPYDLVTVFNHPIARDQFEHSDFIVMINHPGQEYLALEHLHTLGIPQDRIFFPLKA